MISERTSSLSAFVKFDLNLCSGRRPAALLAPSILKRLEFESEAYADKSFSPLIGDAFRVRFEGLPPRTSRIRYMRASITLQTSERPASKSVKNYVVLCGYERLAKRDTPTGDR